MTAAGEADGGNGVDPSSPRPSEDTSYTNAAGGNARVGAQIGVVHGDVRVEYQIKGTSAEEKFTVGLNHLRTGAPREAEKLIREAYAHGLTTNRVRFYYALALVSNRSIKDVVQESFTQLDATFAAVDPSSPDHFADGLLTVRALIGCVVEQDLRGGTPGEDRLTEALRQFDALPADLREEVGRHLDMVLVGAIEDELEARESVEIEHRRLANDRTRRAIKFFLPDPAEPRPRPVVAPPLSLALRLQLAGAGAAALLGLLLLFTIVVRTGRWGPWALWLIDVGAAVAIAWGAGEVVAAREWRRRVDQRRAGTAPPVRDPWAATSPTEEQERFAAFMEASYALAFRAAAPADPGAAERWSRQTAGLQRSLLAETIETYAEHGSSRPDSLEWLTYHRARRAGGQWRAGELDKQRLEHRPRRERLIALYAGAAVLAVGGLLLVGALFSAALVSAFFGLLLTGVGTHFLVHLGLGPYAEHRCRPWVQEEADSEFAGDQAAYEERVVYLRDRPTDLEMAAWLEYDTRFIKSEALKEYGLSRRDVVTHLILTEAAAGCWRARVPWGPARYTEYDVRLFLLTENGVRQFVITLDFVHGLLRDHRRLGFNYEKLASATVNEVGVRFAGRKRKVVLLDAGTDTETSDEPDPAGALVLRQSFRLTLVTRQYIDVLIENYQFWAATLDGEDEARLFALAMETSGVSTAMRILEAVAVEGRDWIRQERTRYLRTLQQYVEQQSRRRTTELPTGPTIATLLDRPAAERASGSDGADRFSLDVYLATESRIDAEHAFAAIDTIAREIGLTGLVHGEVGPGGHVRRSFARVDPDAGPSVLRRLRKIEDGFSRWESESRPVEVDPWTSTLISDLSSALRSASRACLRIGPLVIVKYPDGSGVVMAAKLLGQEDQDWLETFPDIGRHPERVLRALGAGGPAITASGPTETIDAEIVEPGED